ncbi:MAG: regulatory protein RecX [bacterium]
MKTVKSLRQASEGYYQIVFVGDDGVTAPFRLSEDLVVEYRLLVGKRLEEPVFKRFLADLAIDGIYGQALRLIAKTPKTAAEIRTFLHAKTDDPDIAAQAFTKLAARGFIDDRAYALTYFDYHCGIRREGPVKIAFDLERKGVNRDYVQEAIGNATAALIEQNLEWLFAKKLPALAGKPKSGALRAMKIHLYQKGYAPDAVSAFCEARGDHFATATEETALAAADLAPHRSPVRRPDVWRL